MQYVLGICELHARRRFKQTGSAGTPTWLACADDKCKSAQVYTGLRRAGSSIDRCPGHDPRGKSVTQLLGSLQKKRRWVKCFFHTLDAYWHLQRDASRLLKVETHQ